MTAAARYIRPGRATALFNGVVAGLTRVGVSVWGSRVLARARPHQRRDAHDAGEPADRRRRALPRRAARSSPSGCATSAWRARPSCGSGAGSSRSASVELADDEKPALLRAYLKRWKFEVGVFFDGVDASASDETLRGIAPGYPVFRVLRAVVVDRCRRRLPVSVGTGQEDQRPSDRPDTAHYVRSVQRAKSAIKALISAGRSCWVQWPQPGSSSAARRSGTRCRSVATTASKSRPAITRSRSPAA